MLPIYIKNNKCKKALTSALVIIISISSIAGVVFTTPVAVFALSAGGIQSTIASIIISLMLQCGVAPVNNSWLTALNTSYGYTIESAIESGLLTETASGLIDTGLAASIEGASAYTDLGLADIFATTAADEGVAIATGGVNIASTAINVGTLGSLGAFAGAVGVGIGIGILANHLYNKFKEPIKFAIPIDQVNSINQQYATNGQYIIVKSPNPDYADGFYSFNMGIAIAFYNNGKAIAYKNVSNMTQTYYYRGWGKPEENPVRSYELGSGQGGNIGSSSVLIPSKPSFTYEYQAKAYLNNLTYTDYKNSLPKSPDLISPLGNQYYDRDNDTIPGIANIIPEGSDMEPVNMDDYQQFVDDANNNTENGDTGEDIQGLLFDDFVNPFIVNAPVIPDQPIIPDTPVDVPVVPDRPVIPEQPTIPDKPGVTDSDVQDALQGATTIDLRAIFPFCIPFDLYDLLLIFDTGETRRAPHISFTFPLTDWTIDVDLAVFDPVAGILRVLELILFIIGLAVATRSLIGAGGG